MNFKVYYQFTTNFNQINALYQYLICLVYPNLSRIHPYLTGNLQFDHAVRRKSMIKRRTANTSLKSAQIYSDKWRGRNIGGKH